MLSVRIPITGNQSARTKQIIKAKEVRGCELRRTVYVAQRRQRSGTTVTVTGVRTRKVKTPRGGSRKVSDKAETIFCLH